MATTPSTLLFPFSKRGLPGLLLITLGLLSGLAARQHSPLPAEAKHFAYPLAMLLMVGGCTLVSSYVHQRPVRLMKMELLGLAVLVGSLQLSWGGAK